MNCYLGRSGKCANVVLSSTVILPASTPQLETVLQPNSLNSLSNNQGQDLLPYMPWTPSPQSPPSLTEEQDHNVTRPFSLNTPSNFAMTPHTPFPSLFAPLPCLSNGHYSPDSSILEFAANDLQSHVHDVPPEQSEVPSSSQHPHKKSCPVQGGQQLIAPTMWHQYMTLHAQGFFSGAVPGSWLQEQDLFVCPNCQQLVANSRPSSHLRKCTHATAAPSSLSLLSVQVADPSLSPLPTFESVCKLPGRTVWHIPLKDRLAFALVLSSALRSAVHDNSEDAWLKLLMLSKCVLLAPKRAGRHHKPVPISRLCAQWSKGEFSALWNRASNHHSPGPMRLTTNHKSSSVQTAVSLAREGLLSKACQTLTSSGLAPDNNTTSNLLVSKHPKGTPPTPPTAPLLAAPYLPPDFNIMAVLHSFPKDTACGPSGLRIQHLIEAAEVPLQFPICAVLREMVNMLISGKVPVQVARFLAGGNLVALEKNKPNCPLDIRPIAVGEALAGKCLCSTTKAKAHDFLAPFQLGVACQGGAEKIIHGLRSCVDEHWHEVDFAVLKIDLHNAFNRVSRQAVLNACALHIPVLLPWSQWCYGQHPALWHSLGTISSEIGVQQGDPLGPFLFCLVLQQLISAIAEDVDCESLLFHHWYIDDGVVAGPVAAIAWVLAIIQESGPPLGLNINIAKCELFSSRDLSSFPEEMRRSNVPHFEILGAPIGDLVFCAKFVAQKQSEASKLLKELEAVGSIDPQVALLLRQCGSFCRLVHLARNTPPLLVNEAFALFDDCVQQCFLECTAVDASAATWQQAQLSLKRVGGGFRASELKFPFSCSPHSIIFVLRPFSIIR